MRSSMQRVRGLLTRWCCIGIRSIRLCPLVTALALGANLVGQQAYGDPILTLNDDQGNLGTVNIGTGAVTVIGPLGRVLTDIAFAPNGDLFGIDVSNLYTINPSTAATALVGSLPTSSMNALVFSTDGTLFAASLDGNLYRVDPVTAAATVIGVIGFASSGDLAFDSTGQLYLTSTTDELIAVDRSTGAGTLVGPLGFSNTLGLAFGANGVMYGYAGTTIFSINLATGAGTFVLNYAGHGLSNAFGGSFITEAAPSSAPTQTSTLTPTPASTPTNTQARTPTNTPRPCVGDCNASGDVTVNEIIILVNIALGTADASACPNGIPSAGSVDVTLIIQAVNNALNGCGG